MRRRRSMAKKVENLFLYTVESNGKYGWITSSYAPEQFNTIISRSSKRESSLLYDVLQRGQSVNFVDSTYFATGNRIEMAQLIVNKLRKLNNQQLIGQKIFYLYFYGAEFQLNESGDGFNGEGKLADLLDLMGKYPQIDFGWPENEGQYRKFMEYKGDNKYGRLRAAILSYWYRQCNGKLDWLEQYRVEGNYTLEASKNYLAAYRWLWRNGNPSIRSWYYDNQSHEVGLIWHFTDINNMVSILSRLTIDSKNQAQQKKLMHNDNSTSTVNGNATQPWVHDYARFYLRPQTPTQYRNEGIYQFLNPEVEWNRIPKSLKDKPEQNFWVQGHLAHLPVPVFIGLSLEKFLKRGGYITTRELAGKNVSEQPSKMLDYNLTNFRASIDKIYGQYNSPTINKQTEFIFPKALTFSAKDILRIVVRNESEKLVLLTLLAEADEEQYNSKKEHRKINMHQYFEKIIVDPGFFNNDRSSVRINKNGTISFTPEIKKENQRLNILPYTYEKRLSNGKKEKISIPKLKQLTVYVLDINHEYKRVVRLHDPYWILKIGKWIPSREKKAYAQKKGYSITNRYYSLVYLNNHVYDIYRPEGQFEWYNSKDGTHFNELSAEKKHVLKDIEESIRFL